LPLGSPIIDSVFRGGDWECAYARGHRRHTDLRMDYLEFIAGVTSHTPDKGQVIRYYGLCANAQRGKSQEDEPWALGLEDD